MKVSILGGNTKVLAIAMAAVLEDLSFESLNGAPDNCSKDVSYDDGKQYWRGGSRGKGGKIKYTRQ